MVQIVLPLHLRRLAGVESEVSLAIDEPVTIAAVLSALEEKYPALRGTIRDHGSLKRRPMVRYFVCEEDWSLELPDKPLPPAIAEGREPLLIVGAIAGG